MKRALIILKTGSAYREYRQVAGDFEDWIVSRLGEMDRGLHVVDVTRGENLPNPHEISGVIITGSHAMVTEHRAWSERCADWLEEAVMEDLAILGICYGHQLLAYALGGKVGKNPMGLEFGTVTIELNDLTAEDDLFASFPHQFYAHVSHTQSVIVLPPGAVKLGQSERETNQVVRFAKRAWGVQFHPEFSIDYMRYEIDRYRHRLLQAGQDPQQLLEWTQETPVSTSLLQKFCQILED
ncbi:MAG: glutamine amidotransferase [Anaerolineales bacterium]